MWFRCWSISQDKSMCLCVPAGTWLVLPGSVGWTSCLFLILHHMGIYSSACARPLRPTCPVPALFYVQLTHKEIGSNCGDGCYGFIIRVKYLIKLKNSPSLTLTQNRQKNQTANIFQHSPSHLFKHFECHGSPVIQNGTFPSHDPSGPTC